jgi:hypothetical protein
MRGGLVAGDDFANPAVVMSFDVVCHVHVLVDMRIPRETPPRGRAHGTRFGQRASLPT